MSLNPKMFDDKKRTEGMSKLEGFLKTRIGLIGVMLVSFAYVFWGYFTLVRQDKTILEIIISGGVTVFVAYTIDAMLRLQGLMDGALDPRVVDAEEKHSDTVKRAVPFFIYADEWEEEENKIAMKVARTHILAQQGLRYSDFFDENGDATGYVIPEPDARIPKYVKSRYKLKLKALEDSYKFRITPVTLTKLTSDSSTNLDRNDVGRDKMEYNAEKAKIVGLAKVSGFFAFSLVAFEALTGAGWMALYSGLIQVTLFLMLGFVSYYLAFIHMTGEYRGGLHKKEHLLERLISFGERKDREVIENAKSRNDSQATKDSVRTDASGAGAEGVPKQD